MYTSICIVYSTSIYFFMVNQWPGGQLRLSNQPSPPLIMCLKCIWFVLHVRLQLYVFVIIKYYEQVTVIFAVSVFLTGDISTICFQSSYSDSNRLLIKIWSPNWRNIRRLRRFHFNYLFNFHICVIIKKYVYIKLFFKRSRRYTNRLSDNWPTL